MNYASQYRTTTTLTFNNVVTGYETFSVKNININLQQGDIFGLTGRSGSGKSTIINTLTGFLKSRAGEISFKINEEEQQLLEAIGYSTQRNALFPFLTIEENLKTFAELNKVPKKQIRPRIDFLLNKLYLTKHKNQIVGRLSGGMEKRVDIAVTLIHDPKIIIMDEPFNGLDISLQRFIWTLLKELAATGKIIFVSSHLLEDIQDNCNKIGVVENGFFYSPEDISLLLKGQKGLTLKDFLEQIFRSNLIKSEQNIEQQR